MSTHSILSPIVKRLGDLNIEGHLVPRGFYHSPLLRFASGKVNNVAVTILADLVYWYRPSVVVDDKTNKPRPPRNKFSGDILQRSYQSWADYFGFTKNQVEDAAHFLRDAGLIVIVSRDVTTVDGFKIRNATFIYPVLSVLEPLLKHVDEEDLLPPIESEGPSMKGKMGGKSGRPRKEVSGGVLENPTPTESVEISNVGFSKTPPPTTENLYTKTIGDCVENIPNTTYSGSDGDERQQASVKDESSTKGRTGHKRSCSVDNHVNEHLPGMQNDVPVREKPLQAHQVFSQLLGLPTLSSRSIGRMNKLGKEVGPEKFYHAVLGFRADKYAKEIGYSLNFFYSQDVNMLAAKGEAEDATGTDGNKVYADRFDLSADPAIDEDDVPRFTMAIAKMGGEPRTLGEIRVFLASRGQSESPTVNSREYVTKRPGASVSTPLPALTG